MQITQLITHSGGFHADELLSSAVLTRLFPDAQVLRSRDRAVITPAPEKIIYDVGGAFDAQAQIFDHHQRPGPLRANGQPFSSFGLIWAAYGRAYLADMNVPGQDIEDIHAAFDRKFVLPIDLHDNGVLDQSAAGAFGDLTLPALIASLKPVFDDSAPNADSDAFFAALPMVSLLIEAQIRKLAAKARARSLVQEAIAKTGDQRVLELPMGMPYLSELETSGADHILFVLTPRGDEWTLGGIKRAKDTFEQRADLPAAWAGLSDQALEEASGVKGAKFCHNARFIAVAQTREAIVKMAEIAVREALGA